MAARRPFDPSRIRRPAEQPPLIPPAGAGGGPADSAAGGAGSVRTFTVQQVNELVRGAVHRHLPSTLHVLAEIGELSRPASGHVYLSLKDRESELRAVMWRSVAQQLRFQPTSGMEVIATGEIEVYTPRGTYQLIVRRLEPRGAGALDLAFRQLRARLEAEGLFDARRKRPLPPVPFRIGVVTSPTGAALRDILRTLHRRFPAAEVVLSPTRVQGEGAAAEVAAAIQRINRHAAAIGGVDVLIVARGGGSLEDLWAFNEEIAVRAVAASEIPTICGVGHETDTSLCDLAADVRAPTPTAAAELATPDRRGLWEWLDQQRVRMTRSLLHALEVRSERLARLERSEPLARPLGRWQIAALRADDAVHRVRHALFDRLRHARHRLTAAGERLAQRVSAAAIAEARGRVDRARDELAARWAMRERAVRRRVDGLVLRAAQAGPHTRLRELRARLESLVQRAHHAAAEALPLRRERLAARQRALEACNHHRLLQRGYSVVRDARTGTVIRSASEVREGQTLITQTADGEFRSTAHDPRQLRLF
jgi:exodeoxyribonuclease VII large subunit